MTHLFMLRISRKSSSNSLTCKLYPSGPNIQYIAIFIMFLPKLIFRFEGFYTSTYHISEEKKMKKRLFIFLIIQASHNLVGNPFVFNLHLIYERMTRMTNLPPTFKKKQNYPLTLRIISLIF